MGKTGDILSDIYIEFSKGRKCKIINEYTANRIGLSRFIEIWSVETEILNAKQGKLEDFTLFICFTTEFPLTIPKIYLSKEAYVKVGSVAHIDTDRLICTFDEVSANFNENFPLEIIEECFKKARSIIEDGISGKNDIDIDDEFIAYWEGTYSQKDSLLFEGLSIIESLDINSKFLPMFVIPNGYRGYKWILHDKGNNYELFKKTLKYFGIKFEESEVYFKAEVPINKPPFEITFKNSLQIIVPDSIELKNFINMNEYKIVVFTKVIKGQYCFFGWKYDCLKLKQDGFRKGSYNPYRLISQIQGNKKVSRISFEKVTTERFQLRSDGFISKNIISKIAFAGLGSIGSNFLPYLDGYGIKEYCLIDNDILKIENIDRHLIGFDGVRQYKCDAVKSYLLSKNPLLDVHIRNYSIVEVIKEEVGFINQSDFLFVFIGSDNIESWIGDQIKSQKILIPTFFVWVEPYLSAGHFIYIHPESSKHYSDFFEDRLFKNNIIDKSEYIEGNPSLVKKEAGCQSSFVPYSRKNINLFLSSIFPKINDIIMTNCMSSVSSTWIGGLEILESLKIKLNSNCIANV